MTIFLHIIEIYKVIPQSVLLSDGVVLPDAGVKTYDWLPLLLLLLLLLIVLVPGLIPVAWLCITIVVVELSLINLLIFVVVEGLTTLVAVTELALLLLAHESFS